MATFDAYNNEFLTIQQSVTAKLEQELPKLRGGGPTLPLINLGPVSGSHRASSRQRSASRAYGEHTGISMKRTRLYVPDSGAVERPSPPLCAVRSALLTVACSQIDQMQLTAKSNAKQSMIVRSAKAQLKTWRSKLQHLESVSDRDLLLSSRPSHSAYDIGGTDDEDDGETALGSTSQQQRQRLLNSTQTLNTSSNRLDNAHRLAAENEEIGQGVLNSLVGQRMQLQGANESLEEADVSVNRASRTITKMVRT